MGGKKRRWRPEQQSGQADNRVSWAGPENLEFFWKASGTSWGVFSRKSDNRLKFQEERTSGRVMIE